MASKTATVQHTPEYLAFQENYDLLIDAVGAELDIFYDAFSEKGSDIHDSTQIVTGIDKARMLIDFISVEIEHDPRVFYRFVELLKQLSQPFPISNLQEAVIKRQNPHCAQNESSNEGEFSYEAGKQQEK